MAAGESGGTTHGVAEAWVAKKTNKIVAQNAFTASPKRIETLQAIVSDCKKEFGRYPTHKNVSTIVGDYG
jgi:hypothetical protein